MARILIVEDEADLRALVEYNLRQAGHEVLACATGREGLTRARSERPDLVLLDLMLPDVSGTEVCRALQAEAATSAIPIMMVTARAGEIDRVVGLELGAEDYLTKPFSPRELVLRVGKILARTRRPREAGTAGPHDILVLGPLRVAPAEHRATVAGVEVSLTATEMRLLVHLLRTGERVQSRAHLLDEVWGGEADVTERTVDTHVKRLRAKLGPAGEAIETVRGVGYRVRPARSQGR